MTDTAAVPAPTGDPTGHAVTERTNRADGLRADVGSLRVPEPSADREALLLRIGMALPVIGIILVAAAWFGTSGTALVNDQMNYLISGGLGGLALILIGVGLWVRFSLARLLRVWLARDLAEQQAQADRVVEALGRIEAAVTNRPT